MDVKMLYQELFDSSGRDKSFNKTITPFGNDHCEDYVKALGQMEAEGRITLTECKVLESGWGQVVRVKGSING